MSRPGVLLVAMAFSAPQPATIGGRRTVSTRAPKCRYVALLLYSWVIFGLGVVVGGCRGRVVRGR